MGLDKRALLIGMFSFFVFTNITSVVCAYQIEYDSRLQTISGSMIPTLQVYDFVYVRNVTGQAEIYASYDDGDIMLFQNPFRLEELFLSRAVEKFQQEGSWYFKTKGDHNIAIDAWDIPEDLVIGKVVALSRLLHVDCYDVNVFSNSAFNNFHFNSTMNMLGFTVTTLLTQSAPNSFLNVTIPNELVTGELDVLVDGLSVYFEHSTNGTHHFIWFNWEGTNFIGNIVLPEFPSLIVLPLFMITILLTVIIYRKVARTHKVSETS